MTAAEPACEWGADSPQPDLRAGNPGMQSIRRCEFIAVNFVRTCLNVNGDIIAWVTIFDSETNVTFKDRLPAAGKHFFAIARSIGWHIR